MCIHLYAYTDVYKSVHAHVFVYLTIHTQSYMLTGAHVDVQPSVHILPYIEAYTHTRNIQIEEPFNQIVKCSAEDACGCS